jgi:serine/threonine protein phosphatase PrpC
MSSFNFNISITDFIKNIDKKQDFATSGSATISNGVNVGKEFYYGIIADGNGGNYIINLIKKLDWNKIMSQDDPWIYFYENYIKNLTTIELSGSTLILMRAFSDHIQTISIGDSIVLIYINGEHVYNNTPHNLNNPSEKSRLDKNSNYINYKKLDIVPKIRNSSSIQGSIGYYYKFVNSNLEELEIATTQAVGHNNITGYQPEYNICHFNPSDQVNLIMGSDGLFDMLIIDKFISNTPILTDEDILDIETEKKEILLMNAEQIVLHAEKRWKKKDWNYHYNYNDYTQKCIAAYPRYDDISAVVFTKEGVELNKVVLDNDIKLNNDVELNDDVINLLNNVCI